LGQLICICLKIIQEKITVCCARFYTHGIEIAVVLLSYPEKAFGNPKALRAFISAQELVSSALSRPDITRSAALFNWKSIDIFSNVQRKAMILTHL